MDNKDVKKKKRKLFSESIENTSLLSPSPAVSKDELIAKLKIQPTITIQDWEQYESLISPSESIALINEIYDGTDKIVVLIPSLLSVPRKHLGDYVQTEASLALDVKLFISVINKNRFKHFSIDQLKAFNKVVKYYEYGTRYKITKRDWRLVRNILWKFKYYYYTKYIELYRSPERTRGLMDFAVTIGKRALLDGDQIRKYEEFIHLARNQKKIEAYRKFRIRKKRAKVLKKFLYYSPKIKTTYVPLKFPVRDPNRPKSEPNETSFMTKVRKSWKKSNFFDDC